MAHIGLQRHIPWQPVIHQYRSVDVEDNTAITVEVNTASLVSNFV
jgi:hypothetical protein